MADDARRPRLLIVDDEPDFADFVRDVGDSMGFEVTTLYSSRDVKEIYMSFRPDVVVSDVSMPDFDGIQLIQWLGERERANEAKCRLVVVSGFGSFYVSVSAKLAQAAGVSDFIALSKPVALDDLMAALTLDAGEAGL